MADAAAMCGGTACEVDRRVAVPAAAEGQPLPWPFVLCLVKVGTSWAGDEGRRLLVVVRAGGYCAAVGAPETET